MQRINNLLCWRPEELVMLCGYYPYSATSFFLFSPERSAYLFIPDSDPPDTFPNELPGVTLIFYKRNGVTEFNPYDRLFEAIRNELDLSRSDFADVGYMSCRKPGGWGGSGAEPPALPEDLYDRIDLLGSGKVVDDDIVELFLKKTPYDVSQLKRAHELTRSCVELFYVLISQKMTEQEIASEIERHAKSFIGLVLAGRNVQAVNVYPFVQSGLNTTKSGTYSRSSSRRLSPGDAVLLEMAIAVDGYWTDVTRAGIVPGGSLFDEKQFETVAEYVRGAIGEALAVIKPQVPLKLAFKAAFDHLASKNVAQYFNHALGHCTGFNYHDKGEAILRQSTGSFKSGMVYTIEPGIYSESLGLGVRIEENILVTEQGFELLSNYE